MLQSPAFIIDSILHFMLFDKANLNRSHFNYLDVDLKIKTFIRKNKYRIFNLGKVYLNKLSRSVETLGTIRSQYSFIT